MRWSQSHNADQLTKELVERRQQLLGAGSNRAQLIVLGSTARSGSTLVSEMLRQAFNADEDTVVWTDANGLHSDIPLYNRFFDLGDLWSETTMAQDWVQKDLWPRLAAFGVTRAISRPCRAAMWRPDVAWFSPVRMLGVASFRLSVPFWNALRVSSLSEPVNTC